VAKFRHGFDKCGWVAEVLNGKRSLTLAVIRRLHDRLGLPAELPIAEQNAAA